MEQLSSRERLLRVFNKETVDRIPVSPFIHMNFVKAFFEDPNVDLIEGAIKVYKHFGFEIMLRLINIIPDTKLFNSEKWKVDIEHQVHGNSTIVTTLITTPERQLRQVHQLQKLSPYHEVSAHLEWLIKDKEDFKQFVKYQPSFPQMDLSGLRRAKELLGNDGIVAPWTNFGVFNYASDLRKLDDLFVDAYDDPDFYSELMDYCTNYGCNSLTQVLNEGIDVLSYSGNIANGSVAGPRFFEENVMEYEMKLIKYVQDRNTHVLYHNCGDAINMIELYNKMGIHAFESMTEPPYSNMDLADSIKRFDKSITLIGNLDQIEFLKTASPEQVKAKVKEKLRIIGNRKGFILGTSDFFEEGTPYENIFAIMEGVKEFYT